MSKTIKIIDLLNKIANGEEVPRKIKYGGIIYTYQRVNKHCLQYENMKESDKFWRYLTTNASDVNDKVEIIEEQEEIDIQDIEPLNAYKLIEAPYMKECLDKNNHTKFCELLKQSELELVDNIKKLGEAVKQLDKIIKEK